MTTKQISKYLFKKNVIQVHKQDYGNSSHTVYFESVRSVRLSQDNHLQQKIEKNRIVLDRA